MNVNTRKFNNKFKEIKSKIAYRDNWRCMLREKGNCFGCLDIDHIIPRSMMGKNEKENLITLCRGHHSKMESMSVNKKIKILRDILISKYNYKYDDKYNWG